jgi:ankyrin repeat protein
MLATHLGFDGIVGALLTSARVPPDERDDEQMTPLMHAARCGYIRVAELLIAHGADIHAVDEVWQ